ncbi:hypothetical protein J1N35_006338 [Gossypium stocksii]|uniref:Uncharacterized protein n=1 Tax=Gossypium stocksii TaxID=47602 RepID=A0A9D3WG54_9ROSI|nr:hypothetical protein J1N35_006338 [Gossypium stocksii]
MESKSCITSISIEIINKKVQVYLPIRMLQLHILQYFHLTLILMINSFSRRDIFLNSQNFYHSIPTEIENPCCLGEWFVDS